MDLEIVVMDPIVTIAFVILLKNIQFEKLQKCHCPHMIINNFRYQKFMFQFPKLWCTMHMFLVMLVMNLIHKAIISTDAHLCKHSKAM